MRTPAEQIKHATERAQKRKRAAFAMGTSYSYVIHTRSGKHYNTLPTDQLNKVGKNFRILLKMLIELGEVGQAEAQEHRVRAYAFIQDITERNLQLLTQYRKAEQEATENERSRAIAAIFAQQEAKREAAEKMGNP